MEILAWLLNVQSVRVARMRVWGFATYWSLWGVSDHQSVRRRSAKVQDTQAAAGIDTSKPPGRDSRLLVQTCRYVYMVTSQVGRAK